MKDEKENDNIERRQTPFTKELIESINKKVEIHDSDENTHEGTLIGFTLPYINLLIIEKKTGRKRFIRNVGWFDVTE